MSRERWRVLGLDGARGGWFGVAIEAIPGDVAPVRTAFGLHPNVAEAIESLGSGRPDRTLGRQGASGLPGSFDAVGIDIPIGLPRRGARDCDLDARRQLGPSRGRSVFPSPVRSALEAPNRELASAITRDIDGRGVSAQAFGLFAKIREVDRLLAERRSWRSRVHEVHPELAFAAWAGAPIEASKKSASGQALRRALVESWIGRAALESALASAPRARLAPDDVLDAFAVAWSALRIAAGLHRTLPASVPSPRDETGLAMRIVY